MDTAPLIYFVEENPNYGDIVDPFFEALDRGEFRVVTSVVTLVEVLVYPLRAASPDLTQLYRDILFDQDNLATVPVSLITAELAAQLRATHNLRTPDAIQLATAIQEGASFFLTNDVRLPAMPNLEILVLNELRNPEVRQFPLAVINSNKSLKRWLCLTFLLCLAAQFKEMLAEETYFNSTELMLDSESKYALLSVVKSL